MTFRAVYFDLDGTLLGPDHQIAPVVVQAIARVRARGVHVGIATGRRAMTTKPHADAIQTDAPTILFNGARVYDARMSSIIFATSLPLQPTLRVIERVIELGVHVGAYVDERLLVDARVPVPRHEPPTHALAAREQADLRRLVHPPVKLLFVDAPEALAEVRRVLVDERLLPQGAHLVRSNPYFLEMLPDGVTKGSGLLRCADQLGIDARDIVTFGDDENDIEMLRSSGLGVAMAHAPASVRAVAARVIGDNEGASVAAALDELFAR